MCYRPTPTLHLNLALTGNFLHFYFLKKTHSVWFISVLKSADMGQCPHKSPCPCNTYVIPMSLYKFMSSFVTKRHGHTHTHTHTHKHTHTHTPLMYKQKHSVTPEWEEVYERGRRKIVERQRDLHPHCSTDAAETDTLFMLFSCDVWDMKQKQGTYGQ